MKKGKIIVLIILIILIGIETFWFLYNKDERINGSGLSQPMIDEVDKNDEKYIVDLFTPYDLNSLEYKEMKEDNITYHIISGLKNKEIEENINKKIKDKIFSLKNKNSEEINYSFYTNIVGSFENVLSMEFIVKVPKTNFWGDEYFKDIVEDVYNCDLNTGDELSITDLVLNKSILRSELANNAMEKIYKNIGFVCSGGPCANPEPDYGKVEDSALAIVNQYNKGNYLFTFTEGGINLYFNDVIVPNPKEYYDIDGNDYKKCKEYKSDYDVEEKRYICQDDYDIGYTTFIQYYKMADNVIIYDKYKSEDNIFTKDRERINRKFMKTNTGNDWTMYEVMEENNNSLVDYNLNTFNFFDGDEKVLDELKNKLIQETSELKKDKFNIYNVNGSVENFRDDRYYVYFEVTHYNLEKEKYLENKKQIYIDKYEKMFVGNIDEEMSYKTEYDYLDEYLTKKAYYFYIIDKNGKEYNTRDLLNSDFNFGDYIPNEWLNLGEYKSISDLVDSSFLMINEKAKFPDRLVIYDDGGVTLKLKYKELEAELGNEYIEKENIRDIMYK